MNISLNNNTQSKLAILFQLIIENVYIKYVYLKKGDCKKIYKNNTVYREEDVVKQKLVSSDQHIYYHFNFGKLNSFDRLSKELLDDYFNVLTKIIFSSAFSEKEKKALNKNLKNINLICDQTIVLRNVAQYHHDIRGKDGTKIKLVIEKDFVLNPIDGVISFKRLVNAFFRVKHHKFDKHYELYIGIRKCIVNDDHLLVLLDFDHGS